MANIKTSKTQDQTRSDRAREKASGVSDRRQRRSISQSERLTGVGREQRRDEEKVDLGRFPTSHADFSPPLLFASCSVVLPACIYPTNHIGSTSSSDFTCSLTGLCMCLVSTYIHCRGWNASKKSQDHPPLLT